MNEQWYIVRIQYVDDSVLGLLYRASVGSIADVSEAGTSATSPTSTWCRDPRTVSTS